MHGQLVAYMLQWTDGTPDPNAVKLAVLTLLGGVIATAGTVLVAFRTPRESRGERRMEREDERYHRSLRAQLENAEGEARQARADCGAAQARVAVYEVWFWRHHMDPTKIVRGDESADDIRF